MGIELRDWVLLRDAGARRRRAGSARRSLAACSTPPTATRLTDRYAAETRRIGVEAIAIALVLILAVELAKALVGDLVPMLRSVPAWPAIVPGLAWPLLRAWHHRRAVTGLRRDIAERLALRSPMAAVLATPARKHNLFAMGSQAVALGVVGIALVAAAHDDGQWTKWSYVPMLALAPIAWTLHFAGRCVDRVHRRRPERLGGR